LKIWFNLRNYFCFPIYFRAYFVDALCFWYKSCFFFCRFNKTRYKKRMNFTVVTYKWVILFFLFLYFHIARKIYFFSFNLFWTWKVGVVIFILSMAIAFLGYVLPWGQMSYWGATVITKFFSVIPFIGKDLVIWIWGGFAVDYPTLTRFFFFAFFSSFFINILYFITFYFSSWNWVK